MLGWLLSIPGKPRRTCAAVALSVVLASGAAAQLGPEVMSWRRNDSGEKGRSEVPDIHFHVSGIQAGVREVWFTPAHVFIRSTGVPSYSVGPFPDRNPAYPADQGYLFRIDRSPAPAATPAETPLGQVGLLVNGVPVYNPLDGRSYNNRNIWHFNAVVVEGPGMDDALGHPAPDGSPVPGVLIPGRYHHHQLSPGLMGQLGGLDPTRHSPIIGYAFDGYPIYGPYGYARPDGTGGIARMTSSYRKRAIVHRNSLPDGTLLGPMQRGPDVGPEYPLGYFIEDFEHISALGLLDQFNGRFSVTPDYPGGTYAYFATIDANGDNAYPYLIGPRFYGTVDTVNLMNNWKTLTIPPTALPLPLWGDVNHSGIVDWLDVMEGIRVLSGLAGGGDLEVADVAPSPSADPSGFGDDRLNLRDVARIARHVNGLDNAHPWH